MPVINSFWPDRTDKLTKKTTLLYFTGHWPIGAAVQKRKERKAIIQKEKKRKEDKKRMRKRKRNRNRNRKQKTENRKKQKNRKTH